jgi:xanthine/CO dehydrogenase XdhC/CoxF family maturation factor
MLSSDGREATGDIEDLELFAMVESGARTALCERRSSARVYEAGSAKVFMEFIRPPQSLVIFGARHDALPLTEFAKALSWQASLIDSRPAYATAERFSCADRIISARPEDACEHLLPEVSESAAVVVMTHNYLHDLEVLRKLLPSPVKYIGLLGPRKRAGKLLSQLAADGATLTGEQLARLYAPVGLDIGAETSEQIALAIVAEIQAALTGRYGGMLKSRERPIHREAEDSSPSGRSVANVYAS